MTPTPTFAPSNEGFGVTPTLTASLSNEVSG
jgi:hypothetical protein